jgi:hypothetical protein
VAALSGRLQITAEPADDSRVRRGAALWEEVMPEPTYRPIETESSGIGALLRAIAPLLLFACIAASFFPDLFQRLPEGWRISPVVLRTVGILAFLAMIVGNARAFAKRTQERKKTISDFANSIGGRYTDAPYRAVTGGWEGGPRVDYTVSGRALVLSLDRSFSSSRSRSSSGSGLTCRISADVSMTRDFQLQIVPGGKAMRFLLSKTFMVPVMKIAIQGASAASLSPVARDAASKAGVDVSSREALQKLLTDRFGYLSSDPITIGEESFDKEFLIKASDPSLGRALASDFPVKAALKALHERASSFQVGLESVSGHGGPAKLVVGTGTFDFTGSTITALDTLARALLEALARLDLLERGGRGAA